MGQTQQTQIIPTEITNQDGIFNLLFEQDDISWKSIIFELVKTNKMNPWDIDISVLSKKYIEMLNSLKKLDFRISGKIVLAAALLLRIKSTRLVGEDMDRLDSLFAQKDEVSLMDEYSYDDLDSSYVNSTLQNLTEEELKLIPRTPQARKRKVSIYDLMDALQKAMEVKKRRVMRNLPPAEFEAPTKTRDITLVIREVYGRIKSYFFKNKSGKLTFSQLLPSKSKEDMVFTFIPLLHLTNARKIDLLQKEHFGEIQIDFLKGKSRKKVEMEN